MPAPRRITSRQHPVVQRCRALAKGRDADEVLLDGEHLVRDALAARVPILTLLALPDRATGVMADASAAGADTYEVTTSVMDAASPVRQPGGILAIARWTPAPLEDVVAAADGPLLALVDVQDPGNVGSAIRAVEALGGAGVLALDATADPGGWKALRGAMGSTFRVPVARGLSADALAAARARGTSIAATLPSGGVTPDSLAALGPVIILLGNEGAGLSDELVAGANTRVSVPMAASVESLNVAVCAALLLDGIRRNRARASRIRVD